MAKKSERKSLSHIQQQALVELATPGKKSLKEVAQKLGVTTRTLQNWNRNPRFQAVLSKVMEELRKAAISSTVLSVQIEAMTNMLDYDLKLVEDFGIKRSIIELGEGQELLKRQVKEISEEQRNLRRLLCELKEELRESGK